MEMMRDSLDTILLWFKNNDCNRDSDSFVSSNENSLEQDESLEHHKEPNSKHN